MKWPQVFARITPNLGDCVFVKIEINLENTIRFLLSIVTPTIGSEQHITGGVFFYLKNSLYWLLQRVYIENLREEERKYNFGNFTASYCTINSNFKPGVIFQNFTRAYKHKTCQLMIFPTTLVPLTLAVSTS